MLRGWADGAALDLLTAGCSAKTAELRQQSAVELCWLLPKARCQFRLRGAVSTLPTAVELEEQQGHWLGLTPAGRSRWGWTEPEELLEAAETFPAELAGDTPLPDHFQLLRIYLEQVDLLELRDHPHLRRRWHREGGWNEERLNP